MRFFPSFRLSLVSTDSALDYEAFRVRLWLMRTCKEQCKRSAKRRKLLKRLRP